MKDASEKRQLCALCCAKVECTLPVPVFHDSDSCKVTLTQLTSDRKIRVKNTKLVVPAPLLRIML
jgi:hypothetical protein